MNAREPLRIQRLAAALLCVAMVCSTARADDHDDHERARHAVQSGQIRPLSEVLDALKKSHPGQVLEVELEQDDGQWLYEIKLLQTDGRLIKLKVNARTAQMIRSRR